MGGGQSSFFLCVCVCVHVCVIPLEDAVKEIMVVGWCTMCACVCVCALFVLLYYPSSYPSQLHDS